MSDWKNVQYKDGKYRTSEGGGGGGASNFADLDDVNFSNLQNGQVAKYNSTTQKWENANESGGGGTITDVEVDGVSVVNQQGVAEIPAIPDGLHHYSTTEHVIGTWIDGKPLYEKTVNIGALVNSNNWQRISHGINNIDKIIDVRAIAHIDDSTMDFLPIPNYRVTSSYGVTFGVNETQISYINNWVTGDSYTYVTLQYTKTTDV